MIQNKFELIPFLQLLLFQLLISKLREKRREINQKLYYINQKKKKKKKLISKQIINMILLTQIA